MILSIWSSFRRLPVWVQAWMALILVPVNLASVFFLGHDGALLVSVLAIGGMAPNTAILVVERGFSKLMALPHIVIWVPLLFVVAFLKMRGGLSEGYQIYLWILLMIDMISLGFDLPDFRKWLRGDRKIA